MTNILPHTAIKSIRKLIPNPRLIAWLSGVNIPNKYLAGSKTGLSRPESVKFSPPGDVVVVCNSSSSSISFYKYDNATRGKLNPEPFFTLSDPVSLDYIHDCTFSPDGNLFICVARAPQKVSVYRLNSDTTGTLSAGLINSFQGNASKLDFPAAVTIHPSGEWFAIANRMSHGICLYRTSDLLGTSIIEPFQVISVDDLAKLDISAPHGFDISYDGEYMVVCSKKFGLDKNARGASALSVFKCISGPDFGLVPEPVCMLSLNNKPLHHVACHPSSYCFSVAIEEHGVHMYSWSPDQKSLNKLDTITVFKSSGGVKGVACSRDGKQLAAATSLDEVLFYDLQ